MKRWLCKGTGVFLFVLMFFCMFTGCDNNQKQGDEYSKEEELIEYLVEEDSYAYDSGILAEWDTVEQKERFTKKCENDKGKSYFVLGSIALLDGDTENAAKYFKKAGDEADDSEYKMKSRAYYELSKCYIYLGQYDKVEESINKMTEIYDGKEEKDYLIQLNIWLSYDILEMPNGISRSVTLMEDTLQIAKETDYDHMENVLSMLARCYSYLDESVKTMQYQLEALDYAKDNRNVNMIVRISTDIGTDYQSKENYGEAIRYLNDAYDKIKSIKNMTQSQLSMGAYITDHLSSSYLLSGDLENAHKYLEESLEFINQEEEGKEG